MDRIKMYHKNENIKILIAEDHASTAELYAHLLQGYHVIIANDGKETLYKLNKDIDIILLDRIMPELNGDDVLKIIRSHQDFKDIYVIALTALKPGVEILTMGFNDYLTKPVTEKELLNAVKFGIVRRKYYKLLDEYIDTLNKLRAIVKHSDSNGFKNRMIYRQTKKRANEIKKEVDCLRDYIIKTTDRYRKILTV